jgi:hypothetical protein
VREAGAGEAGVPAELGAGQTGRGLELHRGEPCAPQIGAGEGGAVGRDVVEGGAVEEGGEGGAADIGAAEVVVIAVPRDGGTLQRGAGDLPGEPVEEVTVQTLGLNVRQDHLRAGQVALTARRIGAQQESRGHHGHIRREFPDPHIIGSDLDGPRTRPRHVHRSPR